MSYAFFIFKLFCKYGSPGECIIHDRDPAFVTKVNRLMAKKFGTDVRVTSAYCPQSNGQTESMIKNVKTGMLTSMKKGGNLIFLT